MGGKSEQVTQTNTPNPQMMAAYENVIGQAQNVASQPLQQYTGPLVAGFSPDQTQGFQNIENAQGLANPYLNSASNLVAQGATPTSLMQYSPEAINSYYSPYQQDVVNATQAEFNNQNAQQQQSVIGNAIQSGAWGGDRAGVAQALTAEQQQLAQAPVIAGLENQGFNQAQGEFNTQQQTSLQQQQANAYTSLYGAGMMGNLGQEAQGSALSGAGALLESGGMQQQLEQQQLDLPYEMFQQQQQYPFATTQYLANIAEGIGPNAGGTSTQTQPGPNLLSQLGGLALAGASFLPLRQGGRIPQFAGGGAMTSVPTGNPMVSVSTNAAGIQSPQISTSGWNPPAGSATNWANPLAQVVNTSPPKITKYPFQSLSTSTGEGTPNLSSPFFQGATPSQLMQAEAAGGMGMLGLARGGYPHYAGGGADDSETADLTDNPALGALDTIAGAPGNSSLAMNQSPQGLAGVPDVSKPLTPAALEKHAGPKNNVPTPPSDTMRNAATLNPPPDPNAPKGLAAIETLPSATPMDTSNIASEDMPNYRVEGNNPFGLDDTHALMLEAGLGMMASPSHFALQGIGQGAMQGLQAYRQQKLQENDIDYRNRELVMQQEREDNQSTYQKAMLGIATSKLGLASQEAGFNPDGTPITETGATTQTNDPYSGFLALEHKMENPSGDPNAKNPTLGSTSGGLDGFTAKTWVNEFRALHPDLANKLSDQDILNQRGKGDFGNEMALAYAKQNASVIQKQGFDINPVNLYLGHHFDGPGAVKILQANAADPNTPMEKLFPADVIAANRLQGQTVGGYISMLQAKSGDTNSNAASSSTGPLIAGKWDKPELIQLTDSDGHLQHMMAQYNERTGQWRRADSSRAAVNVDAANVRQVTNSEGDYSDDAVLQAAQQYNLEGPVALSGSYRDPTFRSRVIDKAAELNTQAGMTGADLVGQQMNTKALGANLTNLTKQYGLVNNFEQTALKNASLAESLMDKGVGPTGTPLLDTWIRSGGASLGNSDITAFNNAIITFKTEYAKIMSGATGGRGTTDQAQREADQLINPNLNRDQIEKNIAVMRQEMTNRTSSLESQISTTQQQLRNGLNPNQSGARQSMGQQTNITPPPMNTRVLGHTYNTPRGPMTWTRDGWHQAQ